MRKLFSLGVFAGVVYAAVCYYPVLTDYMEVRRAAKLIANRTAKDGRDYNDIKRILDEVSEKSRMRLYRGDVRIEKRNTGYHVEIDVNLPVRFLWIDKTHVHQVAVSADADL